MENIDKFVLEQYLKFNDYNKENKNLIQNNFIDELISSNILVYTRLEENCIKVKDIYNFKDIYQQISWKNENNLRIPYINNNKIKAIYFKKEDKNELLNFLS